MGLGDHTNQRPVFWEIILFKGFFLGDCPQAWGFRGGESWASGTVVIMA